MKVIGFTGTTYTLWDKTTREVDGGIRNIYKFIKTISRSLEVAKAQYPEAEIILELRNSDRLTLWRLQQVQYPVEFFAFGKYKGTKITDCTNHQYIRWYFNEKSPEEQAKLKPIIESMGFGFDNEGNLLTPDRYNYYLHKEEYQEAARKKLDEHIDDMSWFSSIRLPITIYPTRNLSRQGKTTIDEITYVFPEYTEFGCSALPMINGKYKHIRGRKLTITDYTVDDLTVYVKTFKIEKI